MMDYAGPSHKMRQQLSETGDQNIIPVLLNDVEKVETFLDTVLSLPY